MPELHCPKNLHLFRAQPIFGKVSQNIAKLRQKKSRNWLKALKTQDFSLHLFDANTPNEVPYGMGTSVSSSASAMKTEITLFVRFIWRYLPLRKL